ncbi:MAG TPA: 30S ribosome-binding factor RbfA [Gammaproteobacteria bacterium]|nr:30S ribosome-binding factor RbfA [Gammaproteobacteria bacterium]
MAREFERSSRVAGQLQRELSDLIRREVKDPRVRNVTVTKVDVTRDLSHAKVLVSVLGEGGPQPEVLEALQHAAGYLRHLLGKSLKMRAIPELRFAQDDVLERAAHLTALINEANRDKGSGETDA